MTEIKEHMEGIGADGVHIGTVDKVEGGRIKLTKKDSGEGSHKGHHHYIDRGLVAGVEGNKVRLSASGAVAVTFEEEKSRRVDDPCLSDLWVIPKRAGQAAPVPHYARRDGISGGPGGQSRRRPCGVTPAWPFVLELFTIV